MAASVISKVCVVLVLTIIITPSTWCFSKNRIVRRVSSAETYFASDEPTVDTSDGPYDPEAIPEYYTPISTNTTNSTDKNLYVIKAVVYEIGILTEVPDNDTDVDVQNERVDISLFNSGVNGSVIDLEHIPFPVQSNISGEVVSLIAPVALTDILGINQTHTPEDSVDAVVVRDIEPEDPILSPYDLLPKVDDVTTEEQNDNKKCKNLNDEND